MTDTNEMPAEVTPQAEQPAVKPAPKFVSQKERFRTVTLEWPIEYDGKVYDSVTVRRMTTSEVAEFIDQVRADAKSASLPMFDVPKEVVDALDADDAEAVNKAVNDFLPRSLRLEAEPEQP